MSTRWSIALALLGTSLCVVLATSPCAFAQAEEGARELTLLAALRLARDNAPTVMEASARVSDAEARIAAARAPNTPLIQVVGSGNGFISEGAFVAQGVAGPPSERAVWADATLNVAWTLFDFGRTADAIEGARAGTHSARNDLRASRQTAMAQAAVAYYTLLSDEDLVAAARESVAQRERSLAVTDGLVAAGVRSTVELTRAAVALDVARSELVLAQARAEDDAIALAATLRLPATERIRPLRPADLRIGDESRAAAERACQARPEVLRARWRVDQARSNLASEQAARLPRVSAQAAWSVRYGDQRQGPIHAANGAQLGQVSLQLTMPVLDSVVSANVQSAEAAVSLAQAALLEQSTSVCYATARAGISAKTADAILTQAGQQAAGAWANLVAIEDRYQNGVSGPLDLIDAQREDAAARVLVVRARLTRDLARLHLVAALGKLETLAEH